MHRTQLHYLLLSIVLLLMATQAQAQTELWNNQRQRIIATQLVQNIDSFTVIPYTLGVFDLDGHRVDSSAYQFHANKLHWKDSLAPDSVLLRYRILPYRLDLAYTLIDTTQKKDAPTGLLVGSYNPYAPQGIFDGNQRLNYNGSFSRGISFGNRQDLVLNSSFNLQMNGEIGDGIKLTAAITDENLPIQPEGNTRQLRDFDRIFIRLEKDDLQLTAGDYELASPASYFLKYYKKLEGATFNNLTKLDNGNQWKQSGSVAIARGQFRRQTIIAQEGNQGPYKLQGASGERFIIVLAGTERVYLDGQLLQRGRDADYTIDYNQGEVRFMARRLITKDSRISVEFDYADQRYLRSLYAVGTSYETDRWQVYTHLYSQQDSKTSTGDLDLSNEEKQRLAEAGDQLDNSFVSTIDTLDASDSQRASYVMVDTTVVCDGVPTEMQFLRFSTEGLLVARFADVGTGNGHYVLDVDNTANERVYKWVAPDSVTCTANGRYSPVRALAAPQLQRLWTTGAMYQIAKQGRVKAEVAYSQKDLNRFSSLDSEDDNGLAAVVDWQNTWALGRDSTSWQLSSNALYELKQQNFIAIAPYRSPDFLRDWNLANVNGIGTTVAAEEQLAQAALQLTRPQWGSLKYRWSNFDRKELYQGNRHEAELLLNRNSWRLLAKNSWLDSKAEQEQTSFVRPHYQIEKTFEKWGNWSLMAESQSERSERQANANSDLLASSFYYNRYQVQLKSPEHEKWQIRSAFRSRQDYQPVAQDFQKSSIAQEGEVEGHWQPNKKIRTSAGLTYRQLEVQDTSLVQLEPANTLLGRIDVNTNLWKGALRSNTSYELGSGQEARVEFIYLFVGAGQGQYIWLDSLYNNDGKIQPNEMEIAPFQDQADHIRVSILTDDFIRTNNVNLNQSLAIDPARLWQKSKLKWQRLLTKFSWQTNLTINRKTRDFEGVQSWNPFQLAIADSALVSVSSNQKHTLFFNRRSTKFDMRLEYLLQPRRQVSTTGYESRLQRNLTLGGRLRLTDASLFRLDAVRTYRDADSEFFNNKDYQLVGYALLPSLQFQPNDKYRIDLAYKWATEENELLEASEKLSRQELQLSANYERWLRASVSYINIDLAGDPRSPVGFVLLNGLQNGQNWVWNASVTRQLGQYLQMTLSYEGRQTGQADPVHVGRAQVTAIF